MANAKRAGQRARMKGICQACMCRPVVDGFSRCQRCWDVERARRAGKNGGGYQPTGTPNSPTEPPVPPDGVFKSSAHRQDK